MLKKFFCTFILIHAIIILLIAIVALGIGIWCYIDAEETKRLDAESVTLKEDLTIEFGKEAKVSDFLANLNGKLVSDNKIDTEKSVIKQIKDFLQIRIFKCFI